MKGDLNYKKSEKLLHIISKKWSKLGSDERIARMREQLKFLRLSAYAGNPEAQFKLACHYENGIYNDGAFYFINRKKMIYWMQKSANGGYPDAIENMAILYESAPEIQDLQKAEIFYEMYDKVTGVTMGRNRKLFLEQLEKGLFVKDNNGYYKLVKNWRKYIDKNTDT